MADHAAGTLQIGTDADGNVVVNHPEFMPDELGMAHIVFSPRQARECALTLMKMAVRAELESLERMKA